MLIAMTCGSYLMLKVLLLIVLPMVPLHVWLGHALTHKPQSKGEEKGDAIAAVFGLLAAAAVFVLLLTQVRYSP